MNLRRRRFLQSTAGGAIGLMTSPPKMWSQMGQTQERPNIILIVTDDQGWWDMGAYGNAFVETLNMDRLARAGVRFTHFYASPVCAPTRASLMTGRYYQRTGVSDTYMGRDVLHEDEITIGQVFREHGYRTALIGKWHLGQYMKYHPNNRGFDEFLGAWPSEGISHWNDPDQLFWNKTPIIAPGYVTDIITDGGISFIQRNRSNPFLLCIGYHAPRLNSRGPDSYTEKYLDKGLPLREAQIYGMVTFVDENVGRLLGAIDAAGIGSNTFTLFMSDNGGSSQYFRAGLRGGKASVYEGGIRVPFICHWPGHFPAGTSTQAMAQDIDIFPTLCEIIGAPLPKDRKIDGKSIFPLLRYGDGESPHKYLFHQWNHVRPLQKPALPLPQTFNEADRKGFRPNWAVRDEHGYKLVVTWDDARSPRDPELFHLGSDPGETTNVASQHADIVRKLQAEFEKWFSDVTAGQDYKPVLIEVGRPDENPVLLDITWADPIGEKIRPEYEGWFGNVINNWSEVGDSVRWRIDVVQPGRYEIILNYGCRAGDAGSKLRIKVGKAELVHVVRATAGRTIFRPLVAGTVELAKGAAVFAIRPLSIIGTELFALHQVWLNKLEKA